MRIRRLIFAVVMMILSLNMVAFAEERRPLGGNERRLTALNEDYIPIKNAWHHEYDGAWIYLDEEGLALQNTWFHDPADGKWYYFDEYCYMLHDTTTPDGYQVGSDGAWIKDGQVVVENVKNTITDVNK